MRFASPTWRRALVFAAAVGATCAVFGPPESRADEIDDQIKALKDFEKAGDDGKCVPKMQEMRDSVGDPRVVKELKDLVGSRNDKIACAAVKMIAAMKAKDIEFLRWIVSKLDDKDLYKAKEGRPELFRSMLDAIPPYKADKPSQATLKAALPKLADLVKKFLSTDAEYSTRAIRAYGCVRDRFSMEQMLDWGEQIESRSSKSGGGNSKKGASQDTRDNEDKAKKAVLETLAEMTGKDAGTDVATWRKWWNDNGKTFTFPAPADPNDPAAVAAAAAVGPAVPTGAEFKDEVYGYSVKRPEAEGWTWAKPDYDGPRMAIGYSSPDDPGYLLARVYIIVQNPAKAPPKDVKGMVEWTLANPAKTEIDAHDKAPDVKEAKLGGADWTVIVAKGEGTGYKAGFGTLERRFYVVKLDAYILWLDAFVRAGAEDDVKKALWNCVETVALPAPKK